METKMTLWTRRQALKLGLAGGASLMAGPALAQLQIVVEGANFEPLPVAIPDFASSDPTFGREVADIVRNNLRRSGLFLPLDPASLPVRVGDVNAQPDFSIWRTVNVDGLVMGAVERGAQINASVRVWDTAQQTQVVGTQLGTGSQSWRRIGHIVSDAIYQALAGDTGYFDTRVVYVAESGSRANRTRRLAIMDQDGANVQYITQGQGIVLTPRFSPANNDQITYMSNDGNNWQINVLQLSTGQQQRVGAFNTASFAPRFSPNGQVIAFSVEQGGSTNLFAMQIGGEPADAADLRRGHRHQPVLLARWQPDRIRIGSGRLAADLRDVRQRRHANPHQLRPGVVFDAGLVAARQSDRLHPPGRRAVFDRGDEPGRIGRAAADLELPCRGPDLGAEWALHHVFPGSGRQ
jgi:Tol biopolymer transport system component